MNSSETDRARLRLRLWLSLFFVALTAPSAVLVHKVYDQLRWESFRVQQVGAEELALRIDRRLGELIGAEDARPVSDYAFLSERAGERYPGRSPLAEFPVSGPIPGLLGWFEVADDGRFSSPLLPPPGSLPSGTRLDPAELAARQARARLIEGVLVGNRLLERVPPSAPARSPELARLQSLPQPDTELNESIAERAEGEVRDQSASREAVLGASGFARAEPEMPASAAPVVTEPADDLADAEDRIAPPAQVQLSQAAFERLASPEPARTKTRTAGSLGRVEELALDEDLASRQRRVAPPTESLSMAPALRDELHSPASALGAAPAQQALEQQTATEAHPEPQRATELARTPPPLGAAVELFTGRVAPFQLGLLDSGHLVLFRSARRRDRSVIQGALIEQRPFLDALVAAPFHTTALSRSTDLIAAYRGEVLAAYRAAAGRDYLASARELSGELLYRTRLSEPFGGFELIFSVSRLPPPAGAGLIGWTAAALGLVLVTGTWLMYRLGLRQIALVRQQQDFVSSVSHELKTPLTSIRMYAEMLRSGLAAPERRDAYYRYIHEESERLSRLIANVLELSRISRNRLHVEPEPLDLAPLLEQVRVKVASALERSGFTLVIECPPGLRMLADPDACIQILINLIDNALKFASGAECRRIEIHGEARAEARVWISVRDHGPGISRREQRRVFEPFYRPNDRRTRETSGSGIGLALVQRLARAMDGRAEILERTPGVEIRIELPACEV